MKRFLPALFFFLLAFPVHATIYLNEILPDPSTSDIDDEWIELYNDSDFNMDITGYLLQDDAKHEFIIPIATVSAHSYYVWKRLGDTLSLNNSNEIISLFDVNKNLLDKFSYKNSKTDQSWSRSPDGSDNWLILPTTLNSSNPTPTPKPSPSPSPTPTPTNTPTSTPTPTPTPTPLPSPSIKPSTAAPSVALAKEGTVAGLTVNSIHLTPVRSPSPSPSPNLQGQPARRGGALEGPTLNLTRARTALLVGFGLIIISIAGFFGYRKYKSTHQL